jgi:hypothetical protein
MQQVYGMKVIDLNRGDLTGKSGMLIRTDNPCSDVWLNGQESAEAIVPEGRLARREGLNVKCSFKLNDL